MLKSRSHLSALGRNFHCFVDQALFLAAEISICALLDSPVFHQWNRRSVLACCRLNQLVSQFERIIVTGLPANEATERVK